MTRRKHSTSVKKLRENALKREKTEEAKTARQNTGKQQETVDAIDETSIMASTRTDDNDKSEVDANSTVKSSRQDGSSFHKQVEKSSRIEEDHDAIEDEDSYKRPIELDELDLRKLLTADNITTLRAAGALSFDLQEDDEQDYSSDDELVDDDNEDEDAIDDEDDLEDDDLGDEPTFDELQKDSEIIVDNGDNGAMKILDNLVVYEVDGWIDRNTGKPLSKRKLRQNPPVISFRQHVSGDETGEQDSAVSLVVTRALADQMSTMFGKIRDSYDGIEEKKRKPVTPNSIKEKIAMEWKYEPTKVVLTIVLILLLIAVVVYGFIIG